MKKKILITGGSGRLALNWALKRSNLDTVLLVSSRQLANFDNVECICININTSGSLDKLLDFHKPDAIIHCAACSDVELCQNSPESANIANNKLAGMVAKSAFSRDIKLVHISTDHLFDGRVSMVDEEVECSPINEYAKTKLLGEQAVLESCPEALVLRLNFFRLGSVLQTYIFRLDYQHFIRSKKHNALRQCFLRHSMQVK